MTARRLKLLIVLAVAAVGIAAAAPFAYRTLLGGKKAMPPPPRLFADAKLRGVSALTAAAQRRGERDARAWVAAHPRADDAAFLRWALARPRVERDTQRELAQVRELVATRTAAGATATFWLEKYGKKKVWKVYAKQYRPFAPPARARRVKAAVTAALALGATLTTDAKAQARRPAPYEIDPSLRALNKRKFAATKRYSYPSKHNVLAFAAVTILARVEPKREPEFRWMADEISYSRLLGGGHVASDLAGGAYLGALLGVYELHREGLA